MNLLVSTASWVFRVDSETHEFSVIKGDEPEYYGISWPFDGKHLCLSHSGVDNAQVMDARAYYLSEKGSISLGDRKRADCLSLPHQILCTKNHILATNTGRNCITVFNQNDLFYRHHWLDGIPWDHETVDGKRGSHFNSLYQTGDRLYLLAHNHNKPNHSYVLELSWPGLEVIRQIETSAFQAHNVWARADGEIVVCNSTAGSVIEAVSGRILWRNERRKSYTRGLACCGKSVFVGDSVDVSSRRARTIADGAIRVLDRSTWKETGFIRIPNSGCINEVRILDEPDECHHNHPFTGAMKEEKQAAERYQDHVNKFKSTITDAFRLADDDWQVCQGFIFGTENDTMRSEEGCLTVATLQGPDVSDSDICADVRLLGEDDFRHGGLVARYSGPGDENMYLGMLIQNGEHCEAGIWRNLDGEWVLLANKRIAEASGRLRFRAKGSSLMLSLNGRRILKVRDSDIAGPGKVGIRGIDAAFSKFRAKPGP